MTDEYKITFSQCFANYKEAHVFLSAYRRGISDLPKQLRDSVKTNNSLSSFVSANQPSDEDNQSVDNMDSSKTFFFWFSGSSPENVTATAALVLRQCEASKDINSLSVNVIFPPAISLPEESSWMDNATSFMGKKGFLMIPFIHNTTDTDGFKKRKWSAQFNTSDGYCFFHYCLFVNAINQHNPSSWPSIDEIIRRAVTDPLTTNRVGPNVVPFPKKD